MICLKFSGWFQCRMPTGADPSDEPRGVSGSTKALPGEPDFDRIIRFQPEGTVRRSHTPAAGVTVQEYHEDGRLVADHPLVGARVELLNNPIFKGENDIVVPAGYEPIVPFVLRVSNQTTRIQRECAATKEFTEFPFGGLEAKAFYEAPGRIGQATGIFDFRKYLDERVAKLDEDEKLEKEKLSSGNADETILAGITRRIKFLRSDVATQWCGLLVPYRIPLAGSLQLVDHNAQLIDKLDLTKQWEADFWMGGWDPDAACGYVEGMLTMPVNPKNPA